ncbi:complement factor H-like isoform X2 [Puntigrus tetrazona]|uniref:complement factor H-like isoform X2 n=1 Tax=Puntigrus tetrazona TaxID=1606681 RepID=UPI001C89C151|nr:complement factor H-like isoform X2 [Puntigrus tetrazona]
MRVPVEIISFSCFLFSVTSAQDQECLGEDIVYENAEPVANISYTDGETVKVYCMTGYGGFYRLMCKNGQWLTLIAQRCLKKRCGHPGETPNGDFKLIKGTDYTYGATVQYTCKKGYEMTSRINHRHCRIKGWDNSVPVCEVTCQLDLTEPEVVKTIPWGKSFFKAGETVEVICKKQIYNKQETFTCTDTGKWDYKPTCEEQKCEAPLNQHLYLLKYYFSGDLYLGARRSYRCESGYRETAEVATCTRDGWTPKPLCAELMCDPPIIPNAQIVEGQTNAYKVSWSIKYKCNPGFEPEEPVKITCDSKGQWTDIRKCSDGTCEEKELKNIQIIFQYPNTTLPYKPGHILVFRCTDDNMRFYGQRAIECLPDGRWNYPYPQCGGTVQCSKPTKNVQFVTLSDEKTEYRNSETLTYTCKEPYSKIPGGVLKCQNGNWNGTFDCQSTICPPPPYLQHGDYNINSTKDDVITAVSYTCQSYFVLTKNQDVYKCVDGKWETPPKCLKPCEIDDFVEQYNLKLPTGKVYIKHAEKYRLNCTDGWNAGNEIKEYVDVLCSNGQLQIDKSCDTQNKRK